AAVVILLAAVVVLVAKNMVLDLAVLTALLAGVAIAARQTFQPASELSEVDPPLRPVVIYNPKSGGGKAVSNNLAAEAAARGIEAIGLQPDDDLVQLVADAVARGADGLAAAGGDGTQALVATFAAANDLPFACIPAGTRNHFALDLGVDRDDVVGALDAFVAGGRERRVDLAEVNGRVFVNNVSMGVYASAVQSDGYRDAKVSTLLDTVSDVVGPDAVGRAAMRWIGPDGGERGTAAVLMVSNNPYRLGALFGNGTRQRLDGGVLGVAATRERGESRLSSSWTCAEFVVESDRPIPLGVDGEALVMDSPVRFRSRPGALRVRIAPQHRGGSPSSGAPNGLGDALRRLIGVISGS
ncbi:MAG: diacylglycerol kinase family protein, partial [Ilumatobacteraceae bacterium]